MFIKKISTVDTVSLERVFALLGDFDIPYFPAGTKYAVYEKIPVAQIPLPEGGTVFLAFDAATPRLFPCGSFLKKSDFLTAEEFYLRLKSIRGM